MSTSVSTSFVKQYESEVHHLFQKRGGILRMAVRRKDSVVGTTTTFQKIGKGVATTKARHGVVTPMNQDHTPIECTMADFYAPDYVDKLDEAKINHDEREAIAMGGVWALGRKVDDQLITSMDATTQTAVTWTFTNAQTIENSMLSTMLALDNADVPNDGERYVAISPKAFAMAMKVNSFRSADFVGPDGLPFTQGAPVHGWKRWMNALWTAHTGLPNADGSSSGTKGFAWHKRAVGYGTGAHAGNVAANPSVKAEINYIPERVAHLVNNYMSGGACNVDDTGIHELTLDDSASLPTA